MNKPIMYIERRYFFTDDRIEMYCEIWQYSDKSMPSAIFYEYNYGAIEHIKRMNR